jgi:nucleotide-binding universal stress UspA family protein
MSEQNKILVAWDFSPKAQNALEHALQLAAISNDNVELVHIIDDKEGYSDACVRMDKAVENTSIEFGQEISYVVKEGNVFTTLGEYALEQQAVLVLMGTHGMKGMQKLTGSWALKVIASSQVPFIVVQGPPRNKHYSNIVFPVDFRKESKQKLKWVGYLASNFKLLVNVLVPNTNDSIHAKKIKNNLEFAKKYLGNKDIEYEIHESKAKGSFVKQTIDFSKYIDADLIIIVITKDIGLNDYMFGADEQKLIANNLEIPVMCIQPRTDLTKYEKLF